MAKVQKGLLINEELLRLIESHQKTTGANFTRVITAAVIQYLFQDPQGPNNLWMEHAVEIELGEITVGDMPRERHGDTVAEASAYTEPTDEPGIETLGNVYQDTASVLKKWATIKNQKSDDPIKTIVDHWAEFSKRK